MKIQALTLAGLFELTPERHHDHRGYFSETWNEHALEQAGLPSRFVQDNHSFSAASGTLRGMHFQVPPRQQVKLVRVLSGAIFDVAVDIRKGSPTFGQWVGLEVSSKKGNQFYISAGFAHGFITLAANTEVAYKVSDYHSPEHERTIAYNDPGINIKWPSELAPYVLSLKDAVGVPITEVDADFLYEEQ
jgi:dTDP-4-dehydrorhamnose 3,5-epimerase